MKRKRRLGNSILVFVLAQTAWTCLLGLWIAWYVANTISLRTAAKVLTEPMVIQGFNLVTLVVGLFLLGSLLIAITLIFFSLTQQVKINRTYDDFIGSVTHELKTPLASIRLHLETMNRRRLDEGRMRHLADLMLADAERLERLVSTILGVARIEHRKSLRGLAPIAASDFLPAIILRAAHDLKLPEKSFQVVGTAAGYIKADSEMLKTVFDILIDNALKYSPVEPTLKANIVTADRSLTVELSDNGIGIPKESLKKVFWKFYRVDRSDSPTVKGTGLGLYWAREIIIMHRGTIRATSRGLNLGSTIRIELPLVRNPKLSREEHPV